MRRGELLQPARRPCRRFVWWLLAPVLALLAGCAVGGKPALPPDTLQPSEPEPQVQVVERLQDGREGFRINESSPQKELVLDDFNQAIALLQQRDYHGAIALLQLVVEQEPGVTAPYINLAIAYRQVDMSEEAESALKTALELIPGHPLASNEYGLLLRAAGRFGEARTIYTQGMELFPEYLPLHKNLGILCDIYLGDPACALEQYEFYSAAVPEDQQVQTWIADLRLRGKGQ